MKFVCLFVCLKHSEGFPGGSVVNSPPASAGEIGLIPGQGRSHMARSS